MGPGDARPHLCRASAATVSFYEVADDKALHLAFPGHKLSAYGSLSIAGERTRLNPSLTYFSNRWGYDYDAGAAAMALRKFDPVWLVNLMLSQSDLLVPGLDATVGVFNLLDRDLSLIQPYNGDHPPLPGASREILGSVSYRVPM